MQSIVVEVAKVSKATCLYNLLLTVLTSTVTVHLLSLSQINNELVPHAFSHPLAPVSMFS